MRWTFLLCLWLTACGGGGGGGPAPTPTPAPVALNGFWQGSVTVDNKPHELKTYIINDMVYLFGDTDPGYDYFAVGKNKTSLQAFTRLNRMPEYIWPSDSVPYAYGVIPSPFPTSTPAHDISVNFSVNDTGQLAGTYSYNQKAAPVVLDKWMGANAPANIDGDYKIAFSYHTRFDKDGYPTDYQNYIISMSILNGVGSINITTQDDGLTLPAYETKYSYSNFVIDTSSGCLVSFTDTGTSYSGFCLSDSANLYFIVKTDSGIYRVYQF